MSEFSIIGNRVLVFYLKALGYLNASGQIQKHHNDLRLKVQFSEQDIPGFNSNFNLNLFDLSVFRGT